MLVIDHRGELQRRADAERAAGRRLALVPTMGALHAGHLSLVDEARKRAEAVWVSIFVNPTQFNEVEDFESYPCDLERDLERCREAGVSLVYVPKVEDLYPPNSQTWVEVTELARPLCGASRPGHFRGVATVVAKLLLAAKPHVAVFGEKDFQQLAVIRRMARDLGFDVEIAGAPTVRESDGLALSSRNVRLGPRAREQALALVRSLDAAEAAVTAGERAAAGLLEGVRKELATASQAEIDYAELRDVETLELISDTISGATLLALAVNFQPDSDGRGASVRLIDNRVLLRSETTKEDRT
jgi:pantoate--beta-alanine ligase